MSPNDIGTRALTKKFCFAWLAGPSLPGADRGALLKRAKWTPGDIISVSFLDGGMLLRDKVMKIAKEWTAPDLANLELSFRTDTTNTMIRISFKDRGSWSMIGNTCRTVTDPGRPTMNFGWLTESTPDREIRRVVLHEFGHALGLVHEHQNPAGGIQWNKDRVYEDLMGPPNNLTKEEIDHNVFEPYSKEETNFTVPDPKSIMMYPIPRTWTTDGFHTEMNYELSEMDRGFIAEEYP